MSDVKNRFVIGVDEVGRGALAGPVVTAAVLLPGNKTGMARLFLKKLPPLRDSKHLTPKQREEWFEWIRQKAKNKGQRTKNEKQSTRSKKRKTNSKWRIAYAVARVTPAVIDRINISRAVNRAAERATLRLLQGSEFNALIRSRMIKRPVTVDILLDGGIGVEKKHLETAQTSVKIVRCESIVKGDEQVPAIALASVVAKVTRDRYMIRLHGRRPEYQFHLNKGYGTKKHFAMLRKNGVSEVHRKSFCKIARSNR